MRVPPPFALPLLALLCTMSPLRAEILVKSGEKIAFLGDSITQQGWGNPAGYVRLVVSGLAANGVDVEPIPAGISGHKSNDMLARLQRDVLDKKPNWMTLSCGVNDVWHGANGVPLEEAAPANGGSPEGAAKLPRGTFKKNITELIDKTQAAGVKPVILTATVIKEDLSSPENAKLEAYNQFLRDLAAERKIPVADLNAMFQERLKAENKPGEKVLTGDGVHMNAEGNKLMALGVLKAFGLNEQQLQIAKDAWAKPTPAPAATPK